MMSLGEKFDELLAPVVVLGLPIIPLLLSESPLLKVQALNVVIRIAESPSPTNAFFLFFIVFLTIKKIEYDFLFVRFTSELFANLNEKSYRNL